jgi:tRNA threonylcarbamoyladenosine biosynthesis protein TsaE
VSEAGDAVEFRNIDLQRLRALAEHLHRHLPRQVVIALRGQLGAGKTRFAQEIAVAAGIDAGDVTSPTFTLVQHYQGSRKIHHIDAYRLADEDEFIELGGEELFDDEAMVLVEWPQRIAPSLPSRTLFLDLEIDDVTKNAGAVHDQTSPPDAARTIRASSGDPALMAVLHMIQRELQNGSGADA